ncbi:PIN domain-containing protein [Thermococcus indicus]|uniref:PIN domain-containing protein n=1 Tax=Thermococcus indicus TaxID=2586643 RepID=A0A4Y5SKW4_9EURY|nr:PIN domain-containing protein [Thermococcus indicus]QDA31533.1 PIN domain-containing protein [Thermococcus indicus]
MKDVVFIDTSIIVEYLLNGPKADFAEIVLSGSSTNVTSTMVYRESQGISELKTIMRKYRLMPSDAQIVLTCRNYGIEKIATFDSDFKRVDFLKTMGV